MHKVTTTNPREAAYLLLLASLKAEGFLPDLLADWRSRVHPKSEDGDLAHNIACGACRMALSLDFMAKSLSHQQKLTLKLREKALVRCALYQMAYLDRVPSYAVVDESVALANKYCHHRFASFLNAILRQSTKELPPLPDGDTIPEISIRTSYPPFFVKELIEQTSIEEAKRILEVGNQVAPLMARVRATGPIREGLELIAGLSSPVAVVKDRALVAPMGESPDYYIQNVTPVVLLDNLCRKLESKPKRILDLCAAPGGKLLALHDQFPDASLYANDISEERLQIVKENCIKYDIHPIVTSFKGEEYPLDTLFDLILLDVPCSNSGVLNKRPEARWRINEENLEKLIAIQKNLLTHAIQLLAPGGQIWYLTCSILHQENTQLVKKVSEELGLTFLSAETQTPNELGFDGGFAASLSHKEPTH